MRIFPFPGIVLSLLSLVCTAQQQLMPDGRASAALIYHPSSRCLLLIDGFRIHLDSNRNDVWKWNGKSWSYVMAFGPGSRSLSSAALDERTGEVVLFAGIGDKNYDSKKGDAWTFDGKEWRNILANSPGTRDHHEMVYASHLKGFVVYGGLNDRREFDSTTWLLRDQRFEPLEIPGPGRRYHFAMAYDKKRGKVVLYGGGEENQRSELWEFDGNHWLKIEHDAKPGGRLRHSMVYDEDRQLVLLQGADTSGTTWGWSGKKWRKIAEGGPVEQAIALGYDPTRKVVVAYGGSGENNLLTSALWELKGSEWRKISDNGVWKWTDGKFIKLP